MSNLVVVAQLNSHAELLAARSLLQSEGIHTFWPGEHSYSIAGLGVGYPQFVLMTPEEEAEHAANILRVVVEQHGAPATDE